jgi:hypothetical protein
LEDAVDLSSDRLLMNEYMSGLETHTRMTVDKVLTRPVIRYGSEVWTVSKQEELCLKSGEMKVL